MKKIVGGCLLFYYYCFIESYYSFPFLLQHNGSIHSEKILEHIDRVFKYPSGVHSTTLCISDKERFSEIPYYH